MDSGIQVSRETVWVVIAAWNEGSVIADVVRGVLAQGVQLVVVDDGSRDETASVVLEAGACLVKHPINLGQGAALQTGIEFALSRGASFVVTFDADGQHDPTEILPMVDFLHQEGADICLGSRFLGTAKNISRLRVLTLKAAICFTWLTSGVTLTDAHNGFRAMTRSCAQRLCIKQNRMAHASEVISRIAEERWSYREFPVTIVYSDYSVHKGQRLSGSLKILFELVLRKISK